MCEIAIGTDTGGSVRIPAALCGVVGFKPSRQRISTAGAFPLAQSLDSIGPLARSVTDCAKADAVMAGDDLRRSIRRRSLTCASASRKACRWTSRRHRWQAIFGRYRSSGEGRLPALNEKLALLDGLARVNSRGGVLPAEAFTVHRDRLDRRGDAIDQNVRVRLERARGITAADYIGMLNERTELIRAMDARLSDIDVLAMPTTPIVAPTMAEGGARRKILCPQERHAAAQYLDRQFFQSVRHLAAVAARRRLTGRTYADRAQWTRPAAVPYRGGGGEVIPAFEHRAAHSFPRRRDPGATIRRVSKSAGSRLPGTSG